jgi:hypothetical protein
MLSWATSSSANNFVDSIAFNTGTGVLTLGRDGLADLTQDLDGRYLLSASALTSPLTTKGDIWVFGTANTRLPVGTNGYALVADSSTATGLNWAANSDGNYVTTAATMGTNGILTGTVGGGGSNWVSNAFNVITDEQVAYGQSTSGLTTGSAYFTYDGLNLTLASAAGDNTSRGLSIKDNEGTETIRLATSSSDHGLLYLRGATGGNAIYLDGGAGTNYLNAGDVAIGTTAAINAAKLTVLDSTRQLVLAYDGSNYFNFAADGNYLNITANSTNKSIVSLRDNGNFYFNGDNIIFEQPNEKYFQFKGTNKLTFGSEPAWAINDQSDTLTINREDGSGDVVIPAGNVGIGTAGPSEHLHVESASNTQALFKSTDNRGLIQVADDDTTASIVAENSTLSLGLTSQMATTNINIDTDGKLGIGITDPVRYLDVNSGGTDNVVRFTSTDNRANIQLSDDDTNRYIVTENSAISLGSNSALHVDNLNYVGTNLGIGTTAPAQSLDVRGTTLLSGATDTVPFEVFAYGAGTSAMHVTSGSNTGLGTATPLAKLHINAGAYQQVFTRGSYNMTIVKGNADDRLIFATGAPGSHTTRFSILPTGVDVVNALTVTGTATIGDGSTLATSAAPTADAQIANKKYVDDSISTETPGGSDTQVQYNNGGAFGGNSGFTYNGTNVTMTSNLLLGSNLVHNGDTDTYLGFETDNIRLYAGNTNTMNIKAAGVGIGTNAPNQKLDVAGNINIQDGYNLRWNNATQINILGSSSSGLTYTASKQHFLTYNGSSAYVETLTLHTGGCVGVGKTNNTTEAMWITDTASPDADTNIILQQGSGGGGGLWLYNNSAAAMGLFGINSSSNMQVYNYVQDKDIIFSVNDGGSQTEVMRIDGSVSRVGIGTTAPAYTLDVSSGYANAARLYLNEANNYIMGDSDNMYLRAHNDMYFNIDTPNDSTARHFIWRANTSSELMRLGEDGILEVKSSGKVGIGTAGPTAELDVRGASSAGMAAFVSGTGNGTYPVMHVIDSADTEVAWFEGNRAGDTGAYIGVRHWPASATENARSGIKFQSKDDGGNLTNYASILMRINDYTNGTEDGTLRFNVMADGTETEELKIDKTGLYIDTYTRLQRNGNTNGLHLTDSGGNAVSFSTLSGSNGGLRLDNTTTNAIYRGSGVSFWDSTESYRLQGNTTSGYLQLDLNKISLVRNASSAASAMLTLGDGGTYDQFSILEDQRGSTATNGYLKLRAKKTGNFGYRKISLGAISGSTTSELLIDSISTNEALRFDTNSKSHAFDIAKAGYVSIGAAVSTTDALYVNGNTTINGILSATAKSFNIPHPLYKDKRLVHGSLEGPEHAIYIRGTIETEEKGCLVELPEYWSAMCEDYTVQLTPHGPYTVYIKEKLKDKVMIECSQKKFKFDYYIVGARTDETLEVVQDG